MKPLFACHAKSVMSSSPIGTMVLAISAFLAAPSFASAQSMSHEASQGAMSAPMSGDSSMKMRTVMEGMQKKMESMKMSGDVDHDFVMIMRSHHQAAIDMAQIEVTSGKDASAISAAKKIIVAQKREIAQFDAWLQKHPMK